MRFIIALIFRPDLVDLSALSTRDNERNLQEAFGIAEKHLNVPRLLEPEGLCFVEFTSHIFSYEQRNSARLLSWMKLARPLNYRDEMAVLGVKFME